MICLFQSLAIGNRSSYWITPPISHVLSAGYDIHGFLVRSFRAEPQGPCLLILQGQSGWENAQCSRTAVTPFDGMESSTQTPTTR